MRKVNVYYGDVYAGQLVELSRGNYEFTYDDAFRADGSTPPVSVNLPKPTAAPLLCLSTCPRVRRRITQSASSPCSPTCCLKELTAGHCAERRKSTRTTFSVCWR